MHTFRNAGLILLVIVLMVASFVLRYVARRNEWIPYSTRHQIKRIIQPSATADSSAVNTQDGNWSPVTLNSSPGVNAEDIEAVNALVYNWSVSFADAFPIIPPHESYANRFRRVELLADGALLAIFDMAGLVKLDVSSKILWRHDGYSHHDLHVQPDGSVYVIESRRDEVNGHPNAIIDYIVHVSPNGELLSEVSLYESFKQSNFRALITHAEEGHDIFHSNAVHFLSEEDKHSLASILVPGHQESRLVLVSMRSFDTIAVVYLDKSTIVWAMTGAWKAQHEPVVTNRGTILVFDNRSLESRSRIIEIDPVTQEPVWDYQGSHDAPFFSHVGGGLHPLPNGNLLVVKTVQGRAFELTRDKRIV